VAAGNECAVGFYEHFGFRRIGKSAGILGPLLEMELVLP
jgi:ribosomal protein S18 acetylase RimI-like enzyme